MSSILLSFLSGKGKKVNVHGNSLVYGSGTSTGLPSDPNSLTSLLTAYLGSSYNVNNYGTPGITITSLTSEIPAKVTANYDDTNYDMTIVVMWEITNMLYYGSTASDVLVAINNYCTAVKAAKPQTRIIIGTCLPRGGGGSWTSDYAATEAKRVSINNSIIGATAPLWDGIANVALNSNIGSVGAWANTTYYSADQAHLTNAGYAQVETVFRNAILNTI